MYIAASPCSPWHPPVTAGSVALSSAGQEKLSWKRFIHDENLKLFRKQLAEAADEKKRQLLRDLITEEAAKNPRGRPKSRPD
jgi:hypothetical protein